MIQTFYETVLGMIKENNHFQLLRPGATQFGQGFSNTESDDGFALKMSRLMRKPTMWLMNRSDTNWSVPSQKMTSSWKFLDLESRGISNLCSKTSLVSHEAAQMLDI